MAFSWLILLLLGSSSAFTSSPRYRPNVATALSASLSSTAATQSPRTILLIGPSFLQLNVAKLLKSEGHHPIVVAPQKQLDKFATYLNDDSLCNEENLSIGLPDLPGDPKYDPRFFGNRESIDGVIFTAEEALLNSAVLNSVMTYEGFGKGGPQRAVAALPLSNFINKEKSMGWKPIFNNDAKEATLWADFSKGWSAFLSSPLGDRLTTVRTGSLLGGGVDGPEANAITGLAEEVYKMSLEQYRDLKERAFDRYRCGVQILQGDATNPKPNGAEEKEKSALKGEALEAFRASGGYPEQDRTNRHSLAYALVETYFRTNRGDFSMDSDGTCPREFTVLAKATEIPDSSEWDALFANPTPAEWPTPPPVI